MIIVLLGASGSGKSTIENELATHHGFEKIILCHNQKRLLILTTICIIAIIIFLCLCGIVSLNKSIKCFKEIY